MQNWLEQAQKYADEVIVVDTGSTDNTREIAVSSGAHVYDFPWCHDFAAARNAALEQATGDWITFLDADETFCTGENLCTILAGLSGAEAVAVPIINIDEDDNRQEISRFYAIRMWKHRPQRRYQGKVHEVLCDGDHPVPVHYVERMPIWHTGYSSRRIKAKLARNLPLLRQQEVQQENPLVYRYLADTLYGLQRYEEADKYIRLAIAKEPPTVDGRQTLYVRLLDIIQARQLPLPEQVQIARQLMCDNPSMPDLKARLAILLWRAEEKKEAAALAGEFMEQFRDGKGQNATTAYALLAPIKKIIQEWEWEVEWQKKSTQEQYEAVLEESGKRIRFLFAALLQSQASLGREYLPEPMQHVLEYAAGERKELTAADLDGYRAGLNAVELLDTAAVRQNYAAIALAFSWPVVLETAKRFVDMQEWSIAFSLYQQVPVDAISDAGAFWYEVGCCLYRLQPAAAAECFERALENGCNERDIPAYMTWLKEAADD